MGTTFIGRSGEILRSAMKKLGMDDVTGYINVVRCHPPNNKLPARCAKLCANFLRHDLKALDVEAVMAFGATASKALMAPDKPPHDWPGAIYQVNEMAHRHLLLLAYHPAYILRRPGLKEQWMSDLRRFKAMWRSCYG